MLNGLKCVKKTGVFVHASKMREENWGFSSPNENAWRKLGFFFTHQKCEKKTGVFLHAKKREEKPSTVRMKWITEMRRISYFTESNQIEVEKSKFGKFNHENDVIHDPTK